LRFYFKRKKKNETDQDSANDKLFAQQNIKEKMEKQLQLKLQQLNHYPAIYTV